MAIGLARLFSVRFPVNFHSPYKAADIIDFWRRWHMTLSRFLRDYLYIPLGGNRRGPRRRHVNLMATMLLGGLWHGAAWTFVVWGGLHGILLVVNHAWRAAVRRMAWHWTDTVVWSVAARGLTFVAVLLAWVPFRASDMATAERLWGAMAGLAAADAGLPDSIPHLGRFLPWIAALLAVAWFTPNTQQIMRRYRPVLRNAFTGDRSVRKLEWRPTAAWLAATIVVALVALAMMAEHTRSDFLYFQF
jgi:D-alanyl-lipoteichoic acid acyltransferase DltB (MBOAT superfamily)